MQDVLRELREGLARTRDAGLLRRLEPPAGRDFASNDYLALARHPAIVAAARAALEEHGAGAPSARLLRGHLACHAAAEAAAAAWLGSDAALLVPSGWHANLALVTSLAARGDVLVSDARNHASLVDACRLSGARVEVHAHHDADHAADLLARARGARRRLLVVESVESTGGARAPLAALAQVARRHDAWLLVDEAHAAGLLGPRLAGCGAEPDVADRVLARVVTGGKALGVAGAFVAGPREVVETVLHRGRSFVFTTSVAPPVAAALAAAIACVRAEPERAERALAAAARLRAALAARGVATGGDAAIVPVLLGAPEAAVAAAARIRERGFDVRALRPPTVPEGTSRLRIVCHADHAPTEINALADAVATAVADVPRAAATPPASRARVLAVVGTDTDVGKTVVAALLCRALLRAGAPEDVRYLKPVQTGGDSDTATVRALAGLDAARAGDPLVALPLPASIDQAAHDAGCAVDVDDVARRLAERLATAQDAAWIVECAGGLLVPVSAATDQSDLLVRSARDVVLVARSGLGTLNHTLLTVEALARRRLRLRALFLVGPRHAANERSLAARLDVPLLALPRFDVLDTAALDGWLAAHDLADVLP